MTIAPTPARDHDLASVQCLRGIAAMMVVCFHCFPQLERMGFTGNQHVSLSSGVDIFFVISGFIMLVSTRRSVSRSAGAFLLNRAIRILPIYWLLTSVMVVAALFAPQLLASTKFDLVHVIKSYLMIPAMHPVAKLYWPILIPGWTLNYEMFFYLIFALGLVFVHDRGRALTVMVGSIIAILILIPLFVHVEGVAGFYTSSVMLEFIFGLIAAELFLAGRRLSKGVGATCLILGAGLLLLSDYVPFPDVRGLSFGVPAILIFTGAVFTPWEQTGRPIAFLRVIGDASYSIYLTHMVTMSAIGQGWRRFLGGGMPGNTLLFIVFAMSVCAFGGYIFYRIVEQPLTNWLKRAIRPQPPKVVALSA